MLNSKSQTEDSNIYIDWLENSIAEEHIRYYKYSDFKDIKQIGKGSFGSVFCATWKISNLFALKSFNNNKQTLEQVVKEVIIFIIILKVHTVYLISL
jgi:hypothetical protein